MKRTKSSDIDGELDDLLDLHPRSDDNFENELLSKKPRSDEVYNTVDEEVPQCLIPTKDITKLHKSVTSPSGNCNEILKSHCENGKLNFLILIFKLLIGCNTLKYLL